MDGVQCLLDLSGLVLRGPSERGLGVHVDRLARAQSAHGLRELSAGDVQGAVAQADEFDDEVPSDPYGDDQRGDDGGEAEEDGGTGGGEQRVPERVGPVRGVTARVGLDRTHPRAQALVGDVPDGFRSGIERLGAGARDEHLVLGGAHVVVRAPLHEVVPSGSFGPAEIRRGGVRQRAAGVDGPREQPQPLAVEGPGEPGTAQHGVLLRQCLPRPGEFEQDTGVGAQAGARDAGERPVDTECRRNGPGVLAVRLVPSGTAVQYVGTQRSQPLRVGDEGAEPPGGSGRQVGSVGDGVAVPQAQFRDGAVGESREVLEVARRHCGGVGRVADGLGPFRLERGDRVVDGGPDRRVHALELPQSRDVLRRAHRGVGPQGEQGDDRHHQQADDLGPDGAGPDVPLPRARECVRRRSGDGPADVRALVGRRAACARRPRGGAAGRPRWWSYGVYAWPPRSERFGGVPSLPRGCGAVRQRTPLSTGGRTGTDVSGRPDIGDSATNAAVRKR